MDTKLSAVDLSRRTLERRAIEATICGMPAVSRAAIRASLKPDPGAEFGFERTWRPV